MNVLNFNGKENEIDMSKDLNPDFKEFVKDMTGINSDNELDVYLDNIISNGNLQSIFNIASREFNRYTNGEVEFEFHSWHNTHRLEFQQVGNHIFVSSNILVALYCFYAILLYQSDHLKEEAVKRKCFQYLLGILMDSCLYDCNPVAINVFEFVLNEIGAKGNYLSLAGVLTCTSICFVYLHEMAHFYLHNDATYDKDSFRIEFEADKLAYEIFLDIIERKINNKFDGGLYTDCFQEYAYLAPAMFIGYIQAQKLTEVILYDRNSVEDVNINVTNAIFDSFVKRKEQVIDYIDESPVNINTTEGNALYGGYESSLDSFADSFIATEKIGNLEEYKIGGWERKDEDKVKLIFAHRSKTDDELQFVDLTMRLLDFECFDKPQEFTGITVTPDEITGYVSKIGNIKFNLSEILKLAIVSSLQLASKDSLVYMTLFVELIFTLFGKSKRLLEERDCKVLLSLKELIDQGVSNIDDDKLKSFTKKQYNDLSDTDYRKAIRNLSHTGCISIIDGNIILQDRITVKYNY